MITLTALAPAAEEGWWTLFELSERDAESWTLIGGQMVHLLAAEFGMADLARPTVDMDVLVNVRARPNGTEWISQWLTQRDYELAGVSPEGVGHRFTRKVRGAPGRTIFDVLAPEGLGASARTATAGGAHTVQARGGTQALNRSERVEVQVSGIRGLEPRRGWVRRPTPLSAVVGKAASIREIPVRDNRDRDWQDAALLLAALPDPAGSAKECGKKDRQRLGALVPLRDREHIGWATLNGRHHRQGVAALEMLLDGAPR